MKDAEKILMFHFDKSFWIVYKNKYRFLQWCAEAWWCLEPNFWILMQAWSQLLNFEGPTFWLDAHHSCLTILTFFIGCPLPIWMLWATTLFPPPPSSTLMHHWVLMHQPKHTVTHISPVYIHNSYLIKFCTFAIWFVNYAQKYHLLRQKSHKAIWKSQRTLKYSKYINKSGNSCVNITRTTAN